MANDTRSANGAASTNQHGALEIALIDEFLAEHGHTPRSVADLPALQRQDLWRRAAAHATLRLAEIEARAHFVDDLEG